MTWPECSLGKKKGRGLGVTHRINPLVRTRHPLPALIPGNPQGDPVLGAQLLQLGHDAIGDDDAAGCVQGVHQGGQEIELVLDGVGEEVGVEEDGIGRLEGAVVLEEEGCGRLGNLADHLVRGGGFGELDVNEILSQVRMGGSKKDF